MAEQHRVDWIIGVKNDTAKGLAEARAAVQAEFAKNPNVTSNAALRQALGRASDAESRHGLAMQLKAQETAAQAQWDLDQKRIAKEIAERRKRYAAEDAAAAAAGTEGSGWKALIGRGGIAKRTAAMLGAHLSPEFGMIKALMDEEQMRTLLGKGATPGGMAMFGGIVTAAAAAVGLFANAINQGQKAVERRMAVEEESNRFSATLLRERATTSRGEQWRAALKEQQEALKAAQRGKHDVGLGSLLAGTSGIESRQYESEIQTARQTISDAQRQIAAEEKRQANIQAQHQRTALTQAFLGARVQDRLSPLLAMANKQRQELREAELANQAKPGSVNIDLLKQQQKVELAVAQWQQGGGAATAGAALEGRFLSYAGGAEIPNWATKLIDEIRASTDYQKTMADCLQWIRDNGIELGVTGGNP